MTNRTKKAEASAPVAAQKRAGPNIYKRAYALAGLAIVSALILVLHLQGGTLRAEEIAVLLACVALLNGKH